MLENVDTTQGEWLLNQATVSGEYTLLQHSLCPNSCAFLAIDNIHGCFSINKVVCCRAP